MTNFSLTVCYLRVFTVPDFERLLILLFSFYVNIQSCCFIAWPDNDEH